MEPFGLDKPTITLLLLRLIEWHQHCNISTHLQNLSFIDYFAKYILCKSQSKYLKICSEWPSILHFLCQWSLKTAQNLLPCLYLFRFVLLSFQNGTLTRSVYCNKAAEQHNRPPLKSTNKSLFPWLASAWLWCGVNIEFPNDGPCRL